MPTRVASALLALVLLGLLATAAVLQPSARRFGTHRQLGLPPCSFRVWFDLRCPACGMTTSWAHLVRGQWPAALRANVGGALLALLAAVTAPWLLVSASRGRWLWRAPPPQMLASFALAIVLITLLDWAGRLLAG